MKDKLLQIRVDEDFFSKLEYLQQINGYKSIAETVRKIVEKEFRKEIGMTGLEKVIDGLEVLRSYIDSEVHPVVSPARWNIYSELCDMIDEINANAIAMTKSENRQSMDSN